MKISRAMAGASLAALLALAACTSDGEEPADDATTAEENGAEEETSEEDDAVDDGEDEDDADADESDDDGAAAGECPELSEGESVDATALAQCSVETMDATAGYAAESEVLGMVSEVRVNNDPQAMHMDSDIGEIIAIEGDTWVNVEGEWHEGDPNSEDPIIAALSAAGAEAQEQIDPATQLGMLGEIDLNVTGTDTRLGEEVFVITGSAEEIDELTYYVTADYAILATDVSMTVEGMEVDSSMEVTEWDTAQDIEPPM